MRDFHKVSPAIWNSPAFRQVPDDARLVQFYFVTCAHQNACGCFPLPDGYAITDLFWTAERYVVARDALCAATLIQFDASTSEVLVAKWFRHNPPMNPSHRKSVLAAIERVASNHLRAAAYQGLTDAEDEARAKQVAKSASASAASGNSLLHTTHLSRVK